MLFKPPALVWITAVTVIQAQIAPSLTQAVVDTLLGIIAAGIWKLVMQAASLLQTVRDLKLREKVVDYRLDNHRTRLKKLDNDDEEPYYG